MLHLFGLLKCESQDAAYMAVETHDMSSLDAAQVSIRALHLAFNGYKDCHYRLIYILNKLSPCKCLATEVKRAKQEEDAAETSWECSNGDCNKTEASENNGSFNRCDGCKIARYCSRRCYKDHWRGHTTSTESSHKIACEAIQELKSVLARDGDGGGGSSSHAAASSGEHSV